jgi:hypothetical protein
VFALICLVAQSFRFDSADLSEPPGQVQFYPQFALFSLGEVKSRLFIFLRFISPWVKFFLSVMPTFPLTREGRHEQGMQSPVLVAAFLLDFRSGGSFIVIGP